MTYVSKSLDINTAAIKAAFSYEKTVIVRETVCKKSGVRTAVCFIDGMVNGKIVNESIIERIIDFDANSSESFISELASFGVCASDTKTERDIEKLKNGLCEGNTVVFVDGEEKALLIDTKGYLLKAITEPAGESISKGPHEGFTEEILVNMSLLRRRIANPDLKMEMMEIGEKTHTKVCICYIDKIVKKRTVREVKKRLSLLDCDEILDSNYIAEYIRDNPYSPFKTVGSTERPDSVAAKLLEGRVAIMVNGTPAVLTVPYIFAEYFQSSEDYYVSFYYATVGRILRFISFFISISLPSLYVAFTNYHQDEIPIKLFIAIAASRDGVPISNLLEVIVMLIGFELLREAGDRIPASFGVSLSVVGTLVIGQVAVTAKLISAPVVFIVAITATTGLLIPKMKGAIIFVRLVILALSSVLGIYGYLLGMTLLTVYLCSMRSFGVEYMDYLLPVFRKRSPDVPLRSIILAMKRRPDFAQSRRRRGEKND
ncbi:MAG: spore germination protein [Clostridia bacterium]|nr:spore germination protein [Clostridia bacterium]